MKTKLQGMRKHAGFKSARVFAEYVGINPCTYTDYEQGKVTMSLSRACEIADALDCSLDELADRAWTPAESSSRESQQREQLMRAFSLLSDYGKEAAVAAVVGIALQENSDDERTIHELLERMGRA